MPEGSKKKAIKINLSNCRYDIVLESAKKLGFAIIMDEVRVS